MAPTRVMTFKALSALLAYPSPALQAAAGEIGEVLGREGLVPAPERAALGRLTGELAAWDLFDLQERYVSLFDRSRSLSLNLFEHVHGESRDRGGAMVDLLETYRAGGFDLAGPELPDHLPVLLEFLSTRPVDEARGMLEDAAHIFAALAERLDRRGAPHAAVFRALLALAAAQPDAQALEALKAEPVDDPDDLEALDAAYEEAAVVFGPSPEAGCPVSRDLLGRMSPAAKPDWAQAIN